MNMKGIGIIVFIGLVLIFGLSIYGRIEKTKENNDSKTAAKIETEANKKQTKISDIIDNKTKGSKNLNEIYNPDIIRNKNFKYNPNVDEMNNDNSALNISSGDLNRLRDHYASEYLANKYDLTYTLQDIIDWVKIKYKEPEPETAEDITTSEWTNIQLKGWNQVALDSELEYVEELAAQKLYKEKSKSMTDAEIRDAINTYGPGLRNNGWTDEEKIKNQSIMLYATTNAGITEEYVEDAFTYAEIRILKEYLPEKYNEIAKSGSKDKVRDKIKNKMTPEGDL